ACGWGDQGHWGGGGGRGAPDGRGGPGEVAHAGPGAAGAGIPRRRRNCQAAQSATLARSADTGLTRFTQDLDNDPASRVRSTIGGTGVMNPRRWAPVDDVTRTELLLANDQLISP